jgi:hypothetical protein
MRTGRCGRWRALFNEQRSPVPGPRENTAIPREISATFAIGHETDFPLWVIASASFHDFPDVILPMQRSAAPATLPATVTREGLVDGPSALRQSRLPNHLYATSIRTWAPHPRRSAKGSPTAIHQWQCLGPRQGTVLQVQSPWPLLKVR